MSDGNVAPTACAAPDTRRDCRAKPTVAAVAAGGQHARRLAVVDRERLDIRPPNQQRRQVVRRIAVDESRAETAAVGKCDDDVRLAEPSNRCEQVSTNPVVVVLGDERTAADEVTGRRAVADVDAAVGVVAESGDSTESSGSTKRAGAVGCRRIAHTAVARLARVRNGTT